MAEFGCGQHLLADSVRDARRRRWAPVNPDAGPLARLAPLSGASPAVARIARDGAANPDSYSGRVLVVGK
jgi:hypothetical protein